MTIPSCLARQTLPQLAELDGENAHKIWWLVERLHLTLGRLLGIIEHLYDVAADDWNELAARDYEVLAETVGSQTNDPIRYMHRMFLRVCIKPLRLVEKADRPPGSERWKVRLTDKGVNLVESDDASAFMSESVLPEIVFAREPYFSRAAVERYQEFELRPFTATQDSLAELGGYITRPEFGLFLGRARSPAEVQASVNAIKSYRDLADGERQQLWDGLLNIFRQDDTHKSLTNFTDQINHTFCFFSLSDCFARKRQDGVWYLKATSRGPLASREDTPEDEGNLAGLRDPGQDVETIAKIDPVSVNSGRAAEQLVVKLLKQHGCNVVFYGDRRGFGFDILAVHRRVGRLFVEVKSSLGELHRIRFTSNEWDAANQYGDRYMVVVVENVGQAEPDVMLLQDPSTLEVRESQTVRMSIAAEQWREHTTVIDLGASNR